MNSRISTYKELLAQKESLELSLKTQKMLIRVDIDALKSQFKPMSDLSHGVNGYASPVKTSFLLTLIADEATMFILKKIIIARSGWLGKIVLPPIFRRYTPHFLKDQVTRFFKRVKYVIRSKTPFVAKKTDRG